MNISHTPQQRHERGSAVLILVVLLALMSVIVVSNAVVLRQLKREINLIEARQLKHSLRVTEQLGQTNKVSSKPAVQPQDQNPPP